MAGPLCVLAAGGTGGHMFPAQALAEALVGRGWRVKLSTDARGARFAGEFPDQVPVARVISATPARGGPLGKLLAPIRILVGVVMALAQMIVDRPRVIVGFGGYPTIPALVAGTLLRIPRLIHEQNGIMGRVNRFFAPRVNAVACGSWPTALPAGVVGHRVGNPVRASVLERVGAAYVAPGDHPVSVLVIGGSQGARILSEVVPEAVAQLDAALRRNLHVAHQARGEDEDHVRAAYADAGIEAEVRPFFDDVPRRIVAAQLVISRAGASSVADLSAIGRPAILVPFAAAAGDHQTANARALVEAGAAILIPESRLAPGPLAGEIARILTNPEAAEAMARNARAAGKPDAAETLADLVERLGGQTR